VESLNVAIIQARVDVGLGLLFVMWPQIDSK
jgi:hypothetical protein